MTFSPEGSFSFFPAPAPRSLNDDFGASIGGGADPFDLDASLPLGARKNASLSSALDPYSDDPDADDDALGPSPFDPDADDALDQAPLSLEEMREEEEDKAFKQSDDDLYGGEE